MKNKEERVSFEKDKDGKDILEQLSFDRGTIEEGHKKLIKDFENRNIKMDSNSLKALKMGLELGLYKEEAADFQYKALMVVMLASVEKFIKVYDDTEKIKKGK